MTHFWPGPHDDPPPWMTSLTASAAAGRDEDDGAPQAQDPAP